ncbi:MAG TPA: penicillin-binding protein activator [Steroidobacteraceae bacterium]|nr:penicillin-binding protein activator [Steroidobacteraceae bacterium]HRX88726.1 penicillin-binding protein activator [Steroidobacteraceae bacterium]
MNRLHLARTALLIIACAALAGCPSLTTRTAPPSVDRAQSYSSAGQHAEAARVYEQLAAETAGTDRAQFLLLAARAWLSARRAPDAERVLAGLPSNLSRQQTLEAELLRGGIQIANGRYVEAVEAQIAREANLSAADRTTSRRSLLAQLRQAAERGARLAAPADADPIVRGWLEAGLAAAENARNPAVGATRIAAFRGRYPNHPALEPLAGEPTIGEPLAGELASAQHVGLLLPITGPAAGAAVRIREGFMAAYYQLPAADRPLLRVYDTNGVTSADVISQARSAGATFLVGPLTRDAVAAAAQFPTERPPILALNFLPNQQPAPTQFYQFALSPEDEARAVARRLVSTGMRRGVVLTPEGDWGARVEAAFNEELIAAGGQVIGAATFDAGASDFGVSIKQVMRITDSIARHRRLQSIVGQKLEFEPRRRPDVQFIFAPSPAATARLLRPQLKFYMAGDIPTYTLSDAYDPAQPGGDDIDGLVFPDMPWILGTSSLTTQVRSELQSAFGDAAGSRGRLFAFGYDAFGIYAALQRGGTLDLAGLTGRLTLDRERRVRRDLDWAQIRNGTAQVLDNGGD